MKKLVTLGMVAAVAALAACSTSQRDGGQIVHNQEEAAPYASERTVGRTQAPARAERVFETRQYK